MTRKHRTGNLYRRGNVWWLRYMVEGKTVYESLHCTSREDAEKERKRIMRPLMAADKADVLANISKRLTDAKDEQAAADEEANPPLAISAAWDAYYDSKSRPDSSERTLAGYESAWKRFKRWIEKEHPDIKQMRDVSKNLAAAYATILEADGVTASTFNQHIGLMRLVWRTLAEEIRAGSNPWMDMRRKKLGAQKVAHRRRNLTPEQFDSLLKCAGSADMHDLLFTLGWTGQRLADIVLLKWNSIDFKRKVVTIHPLKLRRTGKEVHIPLLPQLADILKMRKRNAAGPHVFPELVEDYQRDPSALSKRIAAAFDKAELPPREKLPGVSRAVVVYGAHSLRHYFATQALAAGIPAEIVKRITGHTSDTMLANYEHLDARFIGELANKLQAQPLNPQKQIAALPAHEDNPLPPWAAKMIEGMTTKNWKKVKTELLKIHAKPQEAGQ